MIIVVPVEAVLYSKRPEFERVKADGQRRFRLSKELEIEGVSCQTGIMAEEKRKYLRFEIRSGREDPDRGREPSGRQGDVGGISREGLGLLYEGDFPLQAGKSGGFTVSIPDRKMRSEVRGRMIWSKPRGYYLEIGLKILDIDKSVRSVFSISAILDGGRGQRATNRNNRSFLRS